MCVCCMDFVSSSHSHEKDFAQSLSPLTLGERRGRKKCMMSHEMNNTKPFSLRKRNEKDRWMGEGEMWVEVRK